MSVWRFDVVLQLHNYHANCLLLWSMIEEERESAEDVTLDRKRGKKEQLTGSRKHTDAMVTC